jgi:hypothetical protein
MTRIVLFVLAAWHGANGLFMLLAPQRWYSRVPGVPDTGAFNPHFVADIGIAFLGCALALLAAAVTRGAMRAGLLLAPALFLGGHALLHLLEPGGHGPAAWVRDAIAILIPGLLPGVIASTAIVKGKPA